VTGAEERVAALFAAIRRDDPAGVIEQFGSLASAHQYRKLYELTERYVAPGSSVLDWGCGRGHFSYFLVKRGFRVTAYSLEHPPEIFSTLSESERKRLTFVHGGPDEERRLPFAEGQFAAAFSVGVLEHVQELGGDELASLLELRRVLAQDGVFVCYHLPNRYSYIEALSRRLGDRGKGGDFHRYRFTARDILDLCLEAGLSVVDSGRYGFLPRNSLRRLPGRLRNSRALASALNRSDAVLERLFSAVVQNYYFVARPASGQSAVAHGAASRSS
jgi:SAM-dependent methyltransferase